MIQTGIDFETAGEAARIAVAGFLRVGIKIVADDATTGSIEIQRAYGDNGLLAPYSTPKTIQINGSQILTIIVDDCADLAVVVTTPGVGTFDLEWMLDLPAADSIEEVEIDLQAKGTVWASKYLAQGDERATIVVSLSDKLIKAVVEPRWSLDIKGHAVAITGGSIDLDGTPTTIDLDATASFELFCTAQQSFLIGKAFIYKVRKPESFGVLPDNVAYTDQTQLFAELQIFGDRVMIGDLSTGATIIGSNSTANRLVDLPDVDGEIVVLTDATPANNENLIRSGDGYKSIPYAGSSFPSSPYGGQPFYRTDLDFQELFHWDATRSKWLGELITITGSYPAALSAGASTSLRLGGHVAFNTSRGILFPNDMTIVGCTMFNVATASGTVEWREGSSTLGTLLTMTSARGDSDMALDLDFDGDNGWPQKYPYLTCPAGSPASLSNPVVQIFMRRRET